MASAVQLNSSPTVLGNDGNWVTYSIQIGNPPKSFNVLPSTVLSDTWTINSDVCSSLTGNPLTNCQANRGFLFNPSMSSTWEYLFDNSSLAFSLGIEAGYGWSTRDGGSFGHDTLILTSEKGTVPVSGSVIGSMNTNATNTGLLGLASKQVTLTDQYTNETSVTNSLLQILRDAGTIPSMSYSYSAGAFYNKTTGLLILGGYDAASYAPNRVPFTFAADPNNVLSVGLLSISATVDGKTTPLSDGSVQALIDSTVSELWLPEKWCDEFETMFNLTFNSNNQLYTLTDEAIASNNKKNPTVTIKIANTQNSNADTVSINFPWSAFNNTYTDLNNPAYSKPYFSIRRTLGPYTLGRTFLQEAVLIVDHERRNFTVSQVVDFRTNPHPNIVSISSTSSNNGGGGGTGSSTPTPIATSSSSSSSSGGGITGGAIGGIVVAVVVLAAAAIAGFFLWRRRRRNRYSSPEEAKVDTPGPQRLPPAAFSEKSAPSEMPTPQPGSSNDPFIDYHAAQRQNIKAVMAMSTTDHSELDGDLSNGERAQSPLPAYVPNSMHGSSPAAMTHSPNPAELPATTAPSELHSEHASPMSSPPFSPPISELAPSPDEGPLATAADMGWGTEPQSPHSAKSVSLSPVRGGVRLQDVHGNRGGPNSPGIGSSNRGSEVLDMRATSGPLGTPLVTGLGIHDRESSDPRRQDSTRSKNSDSTLVSGISTLPTSSVSAALQSAPPNTRRPGTRD